MSSPYPLQRGTKKDIAGKAHLSFFRQHLSFHHHLSFHQQIGFTGFEAGGHQLAYLPAL
jgi:hypothetical protein